MRPCGAERLRSVCRCLSAQLLYARSPRLEYHLPGPDQSLRVVGAGEDQSWQADRERESEEAHTQSSSTHPNAYPVSTDRHTGCSPASSPLTAAGLEKEAPGRMRDGTGMRTRAPLP
ncbi:hypothetical protein AMECASPLE_015978 [Ameca splendens]|uniref:Uncharacterized protein n=1 Tax=Ameca splendens TaxID=208324 RepID=A0ABV0ZPG6_9TELE